METVIMLNRRRGHDTKERILEAAGKIFAAKGYRDATHAEICRSAGTNVASINYYFGSKENLYRELFEHLSRRLRHLYPLDGGLPASAPAEQRLRAYIHAHLRRLFDPEHIGDLHQIRLAEMFDPTGLLEALLERQLAQDREIIQIILADLLGPNVSKRDLDWCEMSIVGQCFIAAPVHKDGGPRKIFGLDQTVVEDLTAHIFMVSLAGIQAVRKKKK
ncbi:MAG: putative HTH-type transcriptional regulator YttP [Candidatus Hydrogenedentes bacterium ADurb.Bin101]|nr:MAG: putative HTH-type transcriptional regulator YttP [Candidatus Hydrogenedentes bacterium ADurb.Bin101]